jgi:hypothetical protein
MCKAIQLSKQQKAPKGPEHIPLSMYFLSLVPVAANSLQQGIWQRIFLF